MIFLYSELLILKSRDRLSRLLNYDELPGVFIVDEKNIRWRLARWACSVRSYFQSSNVPILPICNAVQYAFRIRQCVYTTSNSVFSLLSCWKILVNVFLRQFKPLSGNVVEYSLNFQRHVTIHTIFKKWEIALLLYSVWFECTSLVKDNKWVGRTLVITFSQESGL